MRSVVFFKKSGRSKRGAVRPAGEVGKAEPPPFRFKGSYKTPPLTPLLSPSSPLKLLLSPSFSFPSAFLHLRGSPEPMLTSTVDIQGVIARSGARRCPQCLNGKTFMLQDDSFITLMDEALCFFSDCMMLVGYYALCLSFIAPSGWAISSLLRNRLLHALHGNGGKGGKGKTKTKQRLEAKGGVVSTATPTLDGDVASVSMSTMLDEVRDADLVQAIKASMPVEAQLRSLPTLVATEWSAPVMSHTQLSAKGGIALVPKQNIPFVLRQVGFTAQPTAILITQAPSSLGLGSYPHTQVACTINLRGGDGDQAVRVDRWCVQLGFGSHVLRVAEGSLVTISQTMLRMVCKQPEEFGWPAFARASNVTSVLEQHQVPLVAISEVQVRADISTSFMAHDHVVRQILRVSGESGSFFKIHASSQSEHAMLEQTLVWLPEFTSLDSARSMLEGLDHLGVVCKRRAPPHRFAARFATKEDSQAFCKKHRLEDLSGYGRWKVYGIPITAGIPGAYELLGNHDWKIHVIEHFDAKSLSFLSANCGKDSPLQIQAVNGHAIQVRFKAINEIARKLQAPMEIDALLPGSLSRLGKQQQDFIGTLTPRRNPDKRPPGRTGETPEAQRPRQDGEHKQ